MEGHNQNQREDHREEVKSRYSEPFNDSPYQYKNDIDHTRNSRYDKSLNVNASQSRERFPESGTNRDQRGLPSEPADRTPGAFDDRIREIISDRMATDPSLDSRDINVIVRHGDVTLAGTVDNTDSKRNAEMIVASMPGVKHVQSQLTIRPAEDE